QGHIHMHYHQVNDRHEIMTGVCHSIPEVLSDGRIRLHETWKWTSGDCSEGKSVIEEV
ncbi:MAG TPA: n-acetylglutamate synthase, partial [Saprospirales bacterium]|nr:n-acetylglutamate synthase [Saprospirales bacterium]